MSQFHLNTTNTLVQDLIESLAVRGTALTNDQINIISALVSNELSFDYHVTFQERIKAEFTGDNPDDNSDYLYYILPLKRHSVTIIQKIQVSVQAVSNEHAYELAKRLNNPLKYGEVFETLYEDAYLQDT